MLKQPWPGMLRGIYGDPERYKQTYWSRFPGMYFAGDGAKKDEEGYLWLLGRVDDVLEGHAADDAVAEPFDDLAAGVDDRTRFEAVERAAIDFRDDDVLRDVHETTPM